MTRITGNESVPSDGLPDQRPSQVRRTAGQPSAGPSSATGLQPRQGPAGASAGRSSLPRGPLPNSPARPSPGGEDSARLISVDLLVHMAKVSPDVAAQVALKNAVGFAMSPEEKGKINSQAIIEIGMPAANTAAKFAALLRDNVSRLPQDLKGPVLAELRLHILDMPPNEKAGAMEAYIPAGVDTAAKFAELAGENVATLPQESRDPVLIKLGLHILKMPQDEQAGAVQAFVAAGDAHPIQNEFLSSLVDAARDGGANGLAYQVIDTLGKDAIRAGENAASIAARLGVTRHEWLLTELVQQHAAGTMG